MKLNGLKDSQNFGIRQFWNKVENEDLLEVVEKIKPAVHIFGHIHDGDGITSNESTTFINACSYNQSSQILNQSLAYKLDK